MDAAVTKAKAPRGRTDLLALGFGTTAAMWALGYFLRLPVSTVPGWLIILLMALCVVLGGSLANRLTVRGWLGGVWVGGIAGLLNLLIFGSLMSGEQANQLLPSAALWLVGSPVIGALLGGIGAAIGGRGRAGRQPVDWPPVLVVVAAAITLLLIVAGGMVTGFESGLAVVDWPNTFGYNMFFYPLARMTGGIYYEHAHRLLGSLAGLTTLIVAINLQFGRQPRWLKQLAWGALVLVIIQGVLGGLRVTGTLTLSTSPHDVQPNIYLAIIHGVVGQLFLASLVALAVYVSQGWKRCSEVHRSPLARTDRALAIWLLVLLIVQLVLGAVLRHIKGGLHLHITLAVIVLIIAAVAGLRLWGIYPQLPRLSRGGLLLANAAGIQLLLGLAALMTTGANAGYQPGWLMVIVTTLHQTMGALLLALAVYLAVWVHRLLRPGA